VFSFLTASARGDCPDTDIQCLIATSAVGTVTSSQGCSTGGGVNVGFEGELPSGSIDINGNCFNTFTNSTGFSYVPMGVVTAGQCFDLFAGLCQIENCSGQTKASHCNTKVDACTVKEPICTSSYSVQQGDSCFTIAINAGMTLDDLQSLNPDVSCSPLQVNQSLCLEITWMNGQALCQGKQISCRRLRLASFVA
jgi:hypothetical protein